MAGGKNVHIYRLLLTALQIVPQAAANQKEMHGSKCTACGGDARQAELQSSLWHPGLNTEAQPGL